MMGRALPIAVCVAVVLAGCGGLPLGGSEDVTRTVNPRLNATPTYSPTPTATPDYPPGVAAEGIVVYELSRAHRQALDDTPTTVRYTVRTVAANGTVLLNQTTRMTVRGDREFVRVSAESRPPVRDAPRAFGWRYWTNESVTVIRTIQNGTVEDDRRDGPPPPNLALAVKGADMIQLGLAEYNLTPAGTVVRNGTTLLVLRADAPRTSASDLRNVSVRVLVTRDGVVREFRTRHTTTIGNRTATVTRQFRLTEVGTATVPRPDWVNATLNRTRTPSG